MSVAHDRPAERPNPAARSATTDFDDIAGEATVTYTFTFDIPGRTGSLTKYQKYIARFPLDVAAVYDLTSGQITGTTTKYLPVYRTEMFERRFKKEFLVQRHALLLELAPLELRGLIPPTGTRPSPNAIFKLTPVITLNEIGAGALSLWLELGEDHQLKLSDFFGYQSPEDVRCIIDQSLNQPYNGGLRGTVSIGEIARYLIAIVQAGYLWQFTRQSLLSTERNTDTDTLQASVCKKLRSEFPVTSETFWYPIFHWHLTDERIGNAPAFQAFTEKSMRALRGLITSDQNWGKKRDDVVQEFAKDHSFTTRESIVWLTHADGSIKVYSPFIETPVLTSEVLIVFELETILVLKHFLYKVINVIQYLQSKRGVKLSLTQISKLREQEIRRVDQYFNVDLLRKDTTAHRLREFRRLLNVDEIFHVAERKLAGLDNFISSQFQKSLSVRQLVLTIVFGGFAAGQVAFPVFMLMSEQHNLQLTWLDLLILTVSSIIVTGLIIYALFGRWTPK